MSALSTIIFAMRVSQKTINIYCNIISRYQLKNIDSHTGLKQIKKQGRRIKNCTFFKNPLVKNCKLISFNDLKKELDTGHDKIRPQKI